MSSVRKCLNLSRSVARLLALAVCVLIDTPTEAQIAPGVAFEILTPASHPTGVAVGRNGERLFLCDGDGLQVLSQLTASLQEPVWQQVYQTSNACQGLTVDSVGRLYVVDTRVGLVRRFVSQPGTNQWEEDGFAAATGGVADGLPISFPRDVAVGPSGGVYLLDSGNGRVLTTTASTPVAWSRVDIGFDLRNPYGLDVDQTGDLWLADTDAGRIVRATAQGEVETFSTYGKELGEVRFPRDVAVLSDGSFVVAETMNHRVVLFDSAGYGRKIIADAPLVDMPTRVSVDTSDRIYVVDASRGRLVGFGTPGSPLLSTFPFAILPAITAQSPPRPLGSSVHRISWSETRRT